MPRPTPAQFAYGSATVVLSTLAMLLLSEARSGMGVAVISVAGLALGLLVAVTVPIPRPAASSPARDAAGPSPLTRLPFQHSEPRPSEHSLHS
ncbi:hypothetical protein [Streptomyces zagrosensis]|uniref:Uncharacterized protein n=1 Tax=Streptomyces zagrosensis TaxID=1042984 RepID=A0A7W9Q7U8_9ACTN|nr:hypothetical protein [Streptomyces zagrosensis]MBB5935213.1 hypothetical protein [Streptomyces zagrosensis]